jgi:gamma-glutamyltranspeptidase/glutathione hydrolase
MDYKFNSHRSPIYSQTGIVATSQPLATAAGIKILQSGGNAADAAIAAAAALNCTEPTSTGIGGDVFVLYYENKTRQVYALNGSGRAPAGLSLQRINNEGLTNLPAYHPYTITVPGACAAWCDLNEKFGKLSMADVLTPAIELAEKGFPVAPITAYFWLRGAEKQLSHTAHGKELLLNGKAPQVGQHFKNLGLAKTFRLIAEFGKEVFYNGEIADAIAHEVQNAGGCLKQADLQDHTSTWETPIRIEFEGKYIYECPPNGQGLAALIALNILKELDLKSTKALSAERLHLQIEAMRFAFADGWQYIADPKTNPAPIEWLLSSDYAKKRADGIDQSKAAKGILHGTPPATSDTVYCCVVDGEGNACSFINSNYMGFGTGIVPKGFGFTLQNRGHNFSLDANHPNALAPKKRPYHTIIPAMATYADTGELFGPFGVMGGFMQPQGHMQVAVSMLIDEFDPQTVLDLPRFCIEPAIEPHSVAVEEGFSFELAAQLTAMGHNIRPVSGMNRAIFGRGQIIINNREYKTLIGASDPRADGCAMTYL